MHFYVTYIIITTKLKLIKSILLYIFAMYIIRSFKLEMQKCIMHGKSNIICIHFIFKIDIISALL